MLRYKILIKLYLLGCVLICCLYGDTILKYNKICVVKILINK
jgi:hypothetical protein